MKTPYSDSGTIQVLLERLVEIRLPRALALEERVDAGGKLSEYDIKFLKRIMDDSPLAKSLSKDHPELRPLMSKLVSLYSDITSKALENERGT